MFLLEGIISCECEILFIPKGMKWQHPGWSGMRIIRLIGPLTVFATSVIWGTEKLREELRILKGNQRNQHENCVCDSPQTSLALPFLKRQNIQLQKPNQSWTVKDFPNISKMNNTTTSPFGSFLRISPWILYFVKSVKPPKTFMSSPTATRIWLLFVSCDGIDPKKGRCFKWLKSAAKMVSRNTFLRHVFKKKSWPDMTGHRIHICFCIVIVPHDVSSYSKQLPKDQPPFPTSRLVLWLIVALDSFHIRKPVWIFSHVHHLELETLSYTLF